MFFAGLAIVSWWLSAVGDRVTTPLDTEGQREPTLLASDAMMVPANSNT